MGGVGPVGGVGPAGGEGKQGVPGVEGSPWVAGGVLPAGASLKGEWGVFQPVAGESVLGSSVSFVLPLGEAPSPHYIAKSGKEITVSGSEVASSECLGSASEPSAAPGSLCVYASGEEDLAESATAGFLFSAKWFWPVAIESWGDQEGVLANTAGKFGFGVVVIAKEAGNVTAKGTWAVTAK
jgi:hypothetical protein